MKTQTVLIGVASAVIAALGLTGCATTLHTIPTDFALGTKEESVAIGRVTEVVGTFKEIKPIGFFQQLGTAQLKVVNLATGAKYVIVCDKSGDDSNFYVALPPGQYRLSKWERGNLTSSLRGQFAVEKGQVMYVGTLKFVQGEGLGNFRLGAALGGFRGRWRVDDEYEDTVKSFREKYPHISQEVVKSLIAAPRVSPRSIQGR